MTGMESHREKTERLLSFLRELRKLRATRSTDIEQWDRTIWLSDLRKLQPDVESPFFSDKGDGGTDNWLKVRRPSLPPCPPLPVEIEQYFIVQGLDRLDEPPVLQARSDSAESEPTTEKSANLETAREKWNEYLEKQWKPWAAKAKHLKNVQAAYEDIDFMRRRVEESEEIYEVILGIGLLCCLDPSGQPIRRHLLTAKAEISLEPRRGTLSVNPTASFQCLQVELDMLEPRSQPHLERFNVKTELEKIGNDICNRNDVRAVLEILAGQLNPPAVVDESDRIPDNTVFSQPRIHFAPALVLRRRLSTAYELLVEGLSDLCSKPGENFQLTVPWRRLIDEGAGTEESDEMEGEFVAGTKELDDPRLYFPLPTNDEQREIAERLEARKAVLVKGPPGTGKSHTIANLVTHLLARGERILVTAQAPKALEVLLRLLPREIVNLCVTALGPAREEQQRLEDSVSKILAQCDRQQDIEKAKAAISTLEDELLRLDRELAEVDREMREVVEADSHRHRIREGYCGTAAEIARQVEERAPHFSWIPGEPAPDSEFPLTRDEIVFAAEVHNLLSPHKRQELELDLGPDSLPTPEEFSAACRSLNSAEEEYREVASDINPAEQQRFARYSDQDLEALRQLIYKIGQAFERLSSISRTRALEILEVCLSGETSALELLANSLEHEELPRVRKAAERIGAARIEFSRPDLSSHFWHDVRRRLWHFREGKGRGWWIFTPRDVKETNYIEECCLIDGHTPRDVESLEKLDAYGAIRQALEDLTRNLKVQPGLDLKTAGQMLSWAEQVVTALKFMLSIFTSQGKTILSILPTNERKTLVDQQQRERVATLARAVLTDRNLSRQRARIAEWRALLQSALSSGRAHPCLSSLLEAMDRLDPDNYTKAWTRRDEVAREMDKLSRYESLLDRLNEISPAIVTVLRRNEGQPGWADRILRLPEGWDWACARTWLRRITQPGRLEDLAARRKLLQEHLQEKVRALAEQKAWTALLTRLEDRTRQSLVAWKNSMKLLGKGTGVHAWQHRLAARRYMAECLPCIPAWIMPLYRVWENSQPKPGLFDTVIVDEASQAGVDALLLFLLAKRIVVVGDDMQNSPEGIGIAERDLQHLQQEYLKDFVFVSQFRHDVSLYEHAERVCISPIVLREHFRCVPEIIRFSNELCYKSAPLVPLRQPPPQRLPPLRRTFVRGGKCEGDGQRIRNVIEANEVVERIVKCIEDPAYANKTMGVIVLQGHMQAEIIENLLAQRLSPQVRAERRLRCGVPSSFQGDERDVVFLSLVVAPNKKFRALTELEAIRRFNVAMSRARDQVWLFHSVAEDDLENRRDLRWKLLHFFNEKPPAGMYEELEKLEAACRQRVRSMGFQPKPYESWFEVDVAVELLRRHFRVRPQVEVAGYRIDLVIEGDQNRLAVECDGDVWHGLDRWDYDMHRQRQLERAGWRFVRIRASEFYLDRGQAIERIIRACEQMKIGPLPLQSEEAPRLTAAASVEEGAALSGQSESTHASEVASQSGASDSSESGPLSAYGNRMVVSGLPDPRNASSTDVQQALLSIIKEEEPMSKHRLFRLYVQRCPGVTRESRHVRSALNRALYALKRSGVVEIVNLSTDKAPEFQEIRLAGNSPRARRREQVLDLLEVPPSELFEVVGRLSSQASSTGDSEEWIMRAVLERFGLGRLTAKRRRLLEKVIRLSQDRLR